MGKANEWIILTIVLILGVILIPIVVTEVQNAETEINMVQKSTYLYPQSNGVLGKSVGSGSYTVLCSSTGNKTLKQSTITLSDLHSDLKSLDQATWTFTYNATVTNSTLNVQLYVDIYVTLSNGTVRDTIVKGASYSANLTGDTNYHVLTKDYAFAKYNVIDETDKLRVDWMVNVQTGANGNTTLSLPESKFGSVYYTYESQSEGWGFTGGSGARTLFLLLPFIFIIGVVVFFIGSMLGKW